MSETNNYVGLAQAEDFAEVISGSHIVLERSPPDYVRKVSQYIECSAGPSNQNPQVESDSGDSLFITQLPAPQPVRKVRRRKSSRHPFKDTRGDSSSTPSDDDDRETSRKPKKKRKIYLPKYNFPFLTERKWKRRCTRLTTKQNQKFHNYAMGGFFKCVELWQGVEDLYEGLPTIDQDNEDISPLTEDEDKSGDEDLKVVAKNLFLAKSKAKMPQPWYTPPQEEGVVIHEREKIDQIPNKVPTSNMLSAKDKTDETHSASTCNDPAVPGNNKARRKIPRSRRTLFQEKLADLETRSKRVPFKEHIASEEESDWQSREGEDADITVTMETTVINAQAPLDLHKNRTDNFSYVTSTPRKKDKRSKGHGVASGGREKNTRQEIELERDLGVKDNAVCSLSRDEPEVEEFSDVVSEPLRDERRRKKKKKKRSHQEPGSLGMNEKSSNCTAPLNGSTEKNVADTTEDKDVQLVSKKKKKKKLSRTFLEESMSEVENQNNRTSSFRLADVEESSAFEAELHKKHKKRKHIDHKGAEDASGDSSHYNLPEKVKVVPKGQKRQHDSQVATNEDRLERGVDSVFLNPHETKVKKKKKKKKHHDHWETEETLSFENEESQDLNSSLNQSHYAESSTEKPSLDSIKKNKHKKRTLAHQIYN
nr:uncharacterized protein LOC125982647 isoform X2 [Syngnathus scovelli]